MTSQITKKYIYQFEKRVLLRECALKPFVNMLISRKSSAIKHLPDKESLIENVWNNCYILLVVTNLSPKFLRKILSIQEFPLKNRWMTFLDKLNSSNQENLNTLPIYLYLTLVRELISNEKDCKPFWTTACTDLSEKLLSPIEIDYVDLHMNSLNQLSKNQEEKSQLLTTKKINLQNKNCQKTYYQLSTSTVANKWEEENTEKKTLLRAIKVNIVPSEEQKKILDEWIDTSNYVYNKTVTLINNGEYADYKKIRDNIVTKDCRKNDEIYQNQISEKR